MSLERVERWRGGSGEVEVRGWGVEDEGRDRVKGELWRGVEGGKGGEERGQGKSGGRKSVEKRSDREREEVKEEVERGGSKMYKCKGRW